RGADTVVCLAADGDGHVRAVVAYLLVAVFHLAALDLLHAVLQGGAVRGEAERIRRAPGKVLVIEHGTGVDDGHQGASRRDVPGIGRVDAIQAPVVLVLGHVVRLLEDRIVEDPVRIGNAIEGNARHIRVV